MNYPEPWHRAGVEAWTVTKHHTFDAHINNTFEPLLCTIVYVGGDTVTLESHTFAGTIERSICHVYPNKELCEQACPPGYADE